MNQIDVRRIRTLSWEYVCSTKIYYFFYPEAERPKPVESSKPPDSSSLAIMDLQYLSNTCQMYSNVWSNWPDYSDQIIQPLFSRWKDLIHDGKQKTIRPGNQSRKRVLWVLEFTWVFLNAEMLVLCPCLDCFCEFASPGGASTINTFLMSCSSSGSKSFGELVQMLSCGVPRNNSENVPQLTGWELVLKLFTTD